MDLFTPLLRQSELTAIFSDEQTVQKMLEVEAALARAEAKCGAIPAEVAPTIGAACKVENIQLAALGESAANAGNLAIPLVKQLTAKVKEQDPLAARYVHWGATSQDVIDTGVVLQLRDALNHTDNMLSAVLQTLAGQTEKHIATVMPGRTWMQHALPITFGLKLAGTLDALLRWQLRLREMRSRVLVLQFGGAAGTLASLNEQGPAVAEQLAQELALGLADTPWHSQRDRLLEVGHWYAGLCATLGKFANDFSLLMQTEVAEVSEPVIAGRGGSSAMPHKRNPVGCAAILTAVQRMPGLMATLYASQTQQHERALGGWQAEWEVLPELLMLAGGVLTQSELLIRGMQVDSQKMRADLDITHGLIMAESVTQALAAFLGKQDAHHLVETLCHQALDEKRSLLHLLENDPRVTLHLSKTELGTLLDPSRSTGSATHFVRQVLARYQEQCHVASLSD